MFTLAHRRGKKRERTAGSLQGREDGIQEEDIMETDAKATAAGTDDGGGIPRLDTLALKARQLPKSEKD